MNHPTPYIRPRRLRASSSIRDLVEETQLHKSDFIWPVFLLDSAGMKKEEISAMPGCFRQSVDQLSNQLEPLLSKGLKGLAVFPCVPENLKTNDCKEAYNEEGFLPKALSLLKERFPNLLLFSDVALDPYSSDGHDGLVKDGVILNDETLEILARQALVHAQVGADFVAPSDMMDGRVAYLRSALDSEGYQDVGILSYSAKYASSFYGPFRDALDSAPKFGDKKTYQMNPKNIKEALREALLDEEEGADLLMVKPALAYLDVISEISKSTTLPVAAYNVSGEYSMIKAASHAGWLDERSAVLEKLTSIKRAGAKIIFSYHTPEVFDWI